MTAEELSRELRLGTGTFLARRRGIIGLSLISAASMGIISLYQMGIIEHLPEPPGFNADKVDAAPEAYAIFATPDAVLGLGSYAGTAVLAAMGGQDRAVRQPWIPLAMAAKVLIDAANALRLTWSQWAKHKAFCSYCLLAAIATFATVPLVVPEARAAFQQLTDD